MFILITRLFIVAAPDLGSARPCSDYLARLVGPRRGGMAQVAPRRAYWPTSRHARLSLVASWYIIIGRDRLAPALLTAAPLGWCSAAAGIGAQRRSLLS